MGEIIDQRTPVKLILRMALLLLLITVAAHAIGYVSGDWRLDGHSRLEAIYPCDEKGSRSLLPKVPRNSDFYLCGVVSGNVNWSAGMYITQDDRVISSKGVKLSPGIFTLPMAIGDTWPPGHYRVEFFHAQKLIAETEFELVAN